MFVSLAFLIASDAGCAIMIDNLVLDRLYMLQPRRIDF